MSSGRFQIEKNPFHTDVFVTLANQGDLIKLAAACPPGAIPVVSPTGEAIYRVRFSDEKAAEGLGTVIASWGYVDET